MRLTKAEFDRFHQFGESKLQDGDDDLTLETLLDLWRIENPDPGQLEEDLRLTRAALRDIENGDRGIPVEDSLARLRSKYNLPPAADEV